MLGTHLAVQITKIATLVDGSVSISLNTQELAPARVGELFALRNKVAFAYISPQEVSLNEQKIIDSLDPSLPGKTPAQRLRSVMYLNWKQNPEGYADAESHYRAKMESIIDTYKSNLP